MQGKPKKKGRGVAASFLPLRENLPPQQAARDATEIDPLRRKHADDADDALIAKSDSAMEANDDLIPGGLYLDARRRELERKPVLSTMDSHGVQDLVNNLSQPPHRSMTDWNPSDPYSADNPDVAKALRAEDLARKRKLQ